VAQPELRCVVVLLSDSRAISPAAMGDPLDIGINCVNDLFCDSGIQRFLALRN
jgi:hypothetical protein